MADKTKVKIVVLDAYLGDREYVFDVPTGKECQHPAFGIEDNKRYCWTCHKPLGEMPAPIEEEARECDVCGERSGTASHKHCRYCQALYDGGLHLCRNRPNNEPSTTPQDIKKLEIWDSGRQMSANESELESKINEICDVLTAHIKEGK